MSKAFVALVTRCTSWCCTAERSRGGMFNATMMRFACEKSRQMRKFGGAALDRFGATVLAHRFRASCKWGAACAYKRSILLSEHTGQGRHRVGHLIP